MSFEDIEARAAELVAIDVAQKRAAEIAALRQYAQILEDHDDIPTPWFTRSAIHVSCADADVLLARRKALGHCTKVFKDNEVGFDHAVGTTGIVIQLRLPRDEVCEVVGEEEVWVEGYTSPGRYEKRKTYKCPESIIQKIGEVGA